ncbi:MAG: FAD-binding protein [Planctomycetes bacterium]|nr:FAD-binding protein [Planctomycetota bacterium]
MASNRYNTLSPSIIRQLEQIVGEGFVIYDPDKLQQYSHDEIPDPHYAHMPEAVVRPRTAREISEIMKLANRERIPITPRGAGSGLSGGAVPIYGGIVLLCDRMNKIIEIDRENMMITVEPGVITNEINEKLSGTGLFYAGYPMSVETCFIGGNVAENAGGGKAVKYGVTGRYVTGLELVTPTGKIITLGGKVLKDVCGYNLISLLVGSEGTLGIFTKITLKLLPAPKASADLLCLFKTTRQAISIVPKIMTSTGITPTAIEFMDRQAVEASCNYLNETIPHADAQAMLLITIDGADEQAVQRDYEIVGKACMEAGAIEVFVADNPTTSQRVWRIRQNIGEAYNLISHDQSNEDIVVPISAIPEFIAAMESIAQKYDVLIPTYGHAGDGNIHARIVKKPDCPQEKWRETLPKLLEELYRLVAWLGGKISGEHGIGHKRKKYLPMVLDQNAIELMRAIKRAWDPNNILNPGKIFDL